MTENTAAMETFVSSLRRHGHAVEIVSLKASACPTYKDSNLPLTRG
jgi:hypothetical protein